MSAGKCYGGCKAQVGPLAGWRKMENMDLMVRSRSSETG